MDLYYIYLITNNINGKNYVGQKKFCPLKTRKITPLTDGYFGSGKYIVRAEQKYGINNFSKEILATCYSPDICNILEIQYIKMYREIGKAEYNIAEGGHADSRKYLTQEEKNKIQEKINKRLNSPEVKQKMSESHKGIPSWNKGVPMSDDSKLKLKTSLSEIDCSDKSRRAAQTKRKNGYKLSESHKQAIINAHLGKKQSLQTIQKRVEKLRGKKRSEESKQKMRESWNYEKHTLSPEVREMISSKVSQKLKGHVVSQETRLKISQKLKGKEGTFTGRHHSEETKIKLRKIGRKRTVSEETKRKISETMKLVRAKQKEENNKE